MARIVVDAELCKSCRLCIGACPLKLIGASDKFNSKGQHPAEQIDPSRCIGCQLCAIMCPDAAISVYK